MATFAKTTFNAAGYAAFRPSYPPKIFSTLLSYHNGPRSLLLDLGCGHGLISRELSPSFTRIIATDPSSSMIKQAISTSSSYQNISFAPGSAEDLSEIEDGSLDMVVAGQAAHWFKYDKVWPELRKKIRRGGTLSFWGYKDNLFVDYPVASKILDHYCYGAETMGSYWEQPGRNILRDLLHAVVPPEEDWEDVVREEYEPSTNGKGSGEGEVMMQRRLNLGQMEGYARTFSCYHTWKAAKENEGKRDIVDEMFEKMVEAEPEWRAKGDKWRDMEVENEWGSYLLMARRR